MYRSRPATAFALLSAILVLCSIATLHFKAQAQTKKKGDDWLLGAANDEQRFKRLEGNLRGFSAQMIEVGERFLRLHTAVSTRNYDLALYQLDKIKAAMDAGIIKRPRRKANADFFFFDAAYPAAEQAFKSGDRAKALAAFSGLRDACMACHKAENIPFMNEQPVFWRTHSVPSGFETGAAPGFRPGSASGNTLGTGAAIGHVD